MKQVISTEKIPIKLWLDDIESGALSQAKNLANLPFAFKHIAIMPDSHQGYGMPIGGVMATKGVIVPNAVGVDIGCGMCAVKTSLTDIDVETIKRIMGEIRKQIPVGKNRHDYKIGSPDFDFNWKLMPEISARTLPTDAINSVCGIVNREFHKAVQSLGTLGGGNHFIEIQKGSDGFIWIMLHSGSRNLGKTVAEYYNDLAYKLNKKWYSNTYFCPNNKKDSLAFFPMDSEEGENYLLEMQYCVEFALANRKLMMDKIQTIFMREIPMIYFKDSEKPFEPAINIAHNYAKMENHFGQNVMIHRKGATLATVDTIGIIPGSQGTKSYIVKGKSNSESFNSCSHGSGRKMGRGQAMRELDLNIEREVLDSLGIIHSIRNKKDLEEAPGAYKDIKSVMANQDDLVEILVELSPLAVIKE